MSGAGRFIAFEGGEGSGKSTQAAAVAARLGAVLTHEPGGTEVGARIRAIVLDPAVGSTLDMRAEALLMAADRAQHVREVIRPALDEGRDVVTDRYAHSSLAYQGHGRGLSPGDLGQLTTWATGGTWPDLVVLIDVPAEVARSRRVGADRFEREDPAFHERVAEGYRRMAAEDPTCWRVVDGNGTVEEVAARVWSAVGEGVPS